MARPRVLILRAPGTNCDEETAYAFEVAGAESRRMHVLELLRSPGSLDDYQILCIPGGFSFGDDIGAGKVFAGRLQHHLGEELARFRDADKLTLGICNGFQALIKSGMLTTAKGAPLVEDSTPPATLFWNDSGRYEDRWVDVATCGDRCVFLRGIERMYLPIAHAEGKFVARDERSLAELESSGRLVLRYVDERCDPSAEVCYPCNPNGSQANVAGLCDESGRIFGLMPHPERHLDPTNHPRWTRGEAGETGDGLALFVNAVRYFG
jgi:phosphoribosylformylglycinamidine synthase